MGAHTVGLPPPSEPAQAPHQSQAGRWRSSGEWQCRVEGKGKVCCECLQSCPCSALSSHALVEHLALGHPGQQGWGMLEHGFPFAT